ncbi:MAG TPA: PilZ domain-containing protein [Geobacter sp.]|nr:PilZ domain-containing protein [Geobacter sp.]
MEKRHFHRVKFHAPGELIHHEMSYRCRLENVSLRGALISADECIMVPLGETCTFSLCESPDSAPIVISVVIMHCFFSMVGVQFVAFADDAETRVLELMKRTTPEPEKLQQEWEAIIAHRAKQQTQSIPEAAAHAPVGG